MIDRQTVIRFREHCDAKAHRSRRDRALAEARRMRRRRLRAVFVAPMLIGWVVVAFEITKNNPGDLLVLLGGACSIPFLATFNLLGHPDW